MAKAVEVLTFRALGIQGIVNIQLFHLLSSALSCTGALQEAASEFVRRTICSVTSPTTLPAT